MRDKLILIIGMFLLIFSSTISAEKFFSLSQDGYLEKHHSMNVFSTNKFAFSGNRGQNGETGFFDTTYSISQAGFDFSIDGFVYYVGAGNKCTICPTGEGTWINFSGPFSCSGTKRYNNQYYDNDCSFKSNCNPKSDYLKGTYSVNAVGESKRGDSLVCVDNPFYSTQGIKIKYTKGENKAYYSFDLNQVNKKIKKAKFCVFVFGNASESKTLTHIQNFEQLDVDDWTIQEIKDLNVDFLLGIDSNYACSNVTQAVKSDKNNGIIAFMLKNSSEQRIKLSTSESEKKPFLEISFEEIEIQINSPVFNEKISQYRSDSNQDWVIDFNLIDSTDSNSKISLDINISTTQEQGTGLSIFKNLLIDDYCSDFNKIKKCQIFWNTEQFEDNNYFLLFKLDKNKSIFLKESQKFEIDQTFPNSFSDLNTEWQKNNVLMHLFCNDSESGCSSIFFRIDSNYSKDENFSNWQNFDSNIFVSNDGNFSIEFYSVDNAQNFSKKEKEQILIDRNAPVLLNPFVNPTKTEQGKTVQISIKIDDFGEIEESYFLLKSPLIDSNIFLSAINGSNIFTATITNTGVSGTYFISSFFSKDKAQNFTSRDSNLFFKIIKPTIKKTIKPTIKQTKNYPIIRSNGGGGGFEKRNPAFDSKPKNQKTLDIDAFNLKDINVQFNVVLEQKKCFYSFKTIPNFVFSSNAFKTNSSLLTKQKLNFNIENNSIFFESNFCELISKGEHFVLFQKENKRWLLIFVNSDLIETRILKQKTSNFFDNNLSKKENVTALNVLFFDFDFFVLIPITLLLFAFLIFYKKILS